jgi:hypothetical protein
MSVNPQLETLMGLIDELQEQMPEGKYLEAMNALRDLHGVCPIPRPPPVEFVPRNGGVILTPDDVIRHHRLCREAQVHNDRLPTALKALYHTQLWKIVIANWNAEQNPPIEEGRLPRHWNSHIRWRTEQYVPEIELWWMARTVEEKKETIQRALMRDYEIAVDEYARHKNPALSVCPFVSRHSIGAWENPTHNPRAKWNCVCGSVNILVKNWKQHEVSEKHTTWHNAGRRIDHGKRRTMLDKTCLVWNATTKEEERWDASTLDREHGKGTTFKDKLEIRQGKVGQGQAIAGMIAKWYVPHYYNNPQSANEWICADLKGKPWEYEPPQECWMTEPQFKKVYEWKPVVDFSTTDVPRIKEEPPRMRDERCPVRRVYVYWMPQEDYATFIAME